MADIKDPRPQTEGALAKSGETDPFTWLAVASSNSAEISARLQWAAQNWNLVSPATTCARVPDGCDVVLSVVQLDVERETYNQQGKRALHKVALDKIAAAVGLVWDPIQSGRLDDARDPRYCEFRAVGRFRDFDGSMREIFATKVMDLREGSAQMEKIKAESKEDKDYKATLRNMRAFIGAHAETKARLRAIRSLGIRTSYSPEEVARPFVIAKLMFHGYSADPVVRRENAAAIRDAMLGPRTLYGATATVHQLPIGKAPPPVGATPADVDDDGVVIETVGTPVPEPTPEPAREPSRAAPPPPPAASPSRSQGSGGEPTFRFGKDRDGGEMRGRPLRLGSDRDLEWYAGALQRGIDDPAKAQYRAASERQLADVRAEQATRRAAAQPSAASRTKDLFGGDDFPGYGGSNGPDGFPT